MGVVADSRERGLAANSALTVYLPYGRNALVKKFVLHTRGNPLAVAPTVRAIVASLDPNLPLADVRSFEEVVQRSLSPQRFNVILLTAFGGLALLLATTGIYGVLSYAMNRRTAEIGLRVALGASPTNILGIALGQGMRPAMVGMLLGAVGAWWLSRYLETLLFGIKPFDSVTYVMVAALLLANGPHRLPACPVAAPCGSIRQLRYAQIEHSVKIQSQFFTDRATLSESGRNSRGHAKIRTVRTAPGKVPPTAVMSSVTSVKAGMAVRAAGGRPSLTDCGVVPSINISTPMPPCRLRLTLLPLGRCDCCQGDY